MVSGGNLVHLDTNLHVWLVGGHKCNIVVELKFLCIGQLHIVKQLSPT